MLLKICIVFCQYIHCDLMHLDDIQFMCVCTDVPKHFPTTYAHLHTDTCTPYFECIYVISNANVLFFYYYYFFFFSSFFF